MKNINHNGRRSNISCGGGDICISRWKLMQCLIIIHVLVVVTQLLNIVFVILLVVLSPDTFITSVCALCVTKATATLIPTSLMEERRSAVKPIITNPCMWPWASFMGFYQHMNYICYYLTLLTIIGNQAYSNVLHNQWNMHMAQFYIVLF